MADQRYQAQNVVYYNGVPYVMDQPQVASGFGALPGLGSIGMGGFGGLGGGALTQSQIDQLVRTGRLNPLTPPKPAAPPYELKTQPPVQSTVPAAGWGGPSGGMSMSDILNGPQFGAGGSGSTGGVPGGMPSPMPHAMPNPSAPQQDFRQFGQATMAKVLNGGM